MRCDVVLVIMAMLMMMWMLLQAGALVLMVAMPRRNEDEVTDVPDGDEGREQKQSVPRRCGEATGGAGTGVRSAGLSAHLYYHYIVLDGAWRVP